MKMQTITLLMCSLAFSGLVAAGTSDSSKKLSLGYHHILPANSVLVNSKASSIAPKQADQLVRSLREEWYQDKDGNTWYTWEEKQKQPDASWLTIGSGIAKQSSHSYKAHP